MSHSPKQLAQKAAARAEAMHHLHNSAVDGKHHDTPMAERMYQAPSAPKEKVRADSGMNKDGMPAMPMSPNMPQGQ